MKISLSKKTDFEGIGFKEIASVGYKLKGW